MGSQFFGPYVDVGGYPPLDILTNANTYSWGGAVAAFIQADSNGNPVWAGFSDLPVVSSICKSSKPQSDCSQAEWIAMNLTNFSNSKSVIISFGGQANVSLAQYAYQNVQAGKTTQNQAVKDLVAKIKSVITMYPNIIGLDFDIEGLAQSDGSALYWALALKCIKKMYPKLRISYTVAVMPTGLAANGLGVFTKFTLNQGFYPDVVNLMVMDYYLKIADMGQAAVDAIEATYKQLLPLYPAGSFGYANLGFTPMIGVNDSNPETTTLANMSTMCQFAQQNGVGMLAFWDAQADLPCILDNNYKAICQIPSTTYTGQPAGAYAKAFKNCMPTS
jgi:hypothetical protein